MNREGHITVTQARKEAGIQTEVITKVGHKGSHNLKLFFLFFFFKLEMHGWMITRTIADDSMAVSFDCSIGLQIMLTLITLTS